MATFCTALTWGLGVSLGGAVGLLVFMLTKLWLDWAFGHRARVEDMNKDSLRALLRRNELMLQIIDAADRIAEAIEEKKSP